MAARVKQDLGVEVEMIEGSRGILDVRVDGDLVFSKHQAGRWPEQDELVEILHAHA